MKFENVFLDIEHLVTQEINSKFVEIGLEKGWFSLHGIGIDLIDCEVEIDGFDKMKGEDFTLFYDYRNKKGKLHYNDGHIEWFKC